MSLPRPVFDPAQEESASKKFLYQASPEVHRYIEKHFRTSVSDAVVREMCAKDPRPDTPACVVPTVVEPITSWLGDKFPKGADRGLYKVQQSMLLASGPLTQLCEDIIYNDAADVPRDVVLDAVQRSLVLMGNANARMSMHRRTVVLEGAASKPLAKCAKDLPLPTKGTFLFGNDFFKELEQKRDARKTLAKATSAWAPSRHDRLPNRSHRGSEGFSQRPWQRRPGA